MAVCNGLSINPKKRIPGEVSMNRDIAKTKTVYNQSLEAYALPISQTGEG